METNKKILMLSSDYPPIYGGIGVHVDHLTRGLLKTGDRVILHLGRIDNQWTRPVSKGRVELSDHALSELVVYEYDYPFRTLFTDVLDLDLQTQIKELDTLAYLNADLNYFKDVLRNIQSENFDLIHVHDNFFAHTALLLKKLLKIPLVTTLHFNETGSETLDAVKNQLIAQSDQCICVSQSVYDYAKAYLPEEQLTIVPNGVEVYEDNPNPPDLPSNNFNFLVNDEKPLYLFFCGRMVEKKGIFVLLEAFDLLKRKSDLPKLVLAYAGEGQDSLRLAEQIKHLNLDDDITLLGYLPNDQLRQHYRAADIVVAPSLEESFGLVACEAMAEHTCVVASRVGGLQGIIRDGVNGLLVEANDPVALSEKLAILIHNGDLRRHLGEVAYQDIKENYSWTSVVKETRTVYERALKFDQK